MVKDGAERDERPTLRPAFDPAAFARHSEKLIAAEPARGVAQPCEPITAEPALPPIEVAAPLPPNLPPEEKGEPPGPSSWALAVDTAQPRPPARARARRAPAITVVAAALIGVLSLVVHRAASSTQAPSPAASEARTAAPSPSQQRVVEVAAAPQVQHPPPPLAPPEVKPPPSPKVTAPRAPPPKAGVPSAAAHRPRDVALDRDAVLNPFE